MKRLLARMGAFLPVLGLALVATPTCSAQFAISAVMPIVPPADNVVVAREEALDLLVRKMVTDEKFAGDKQWAKIQALTKAVTKKKRRMSWEAGNTAFPIST